MIEFIVFGTPKGQPRPRAFARKMGNKFVARVYDAGTAEEWKGQIAAVAEAKRPTTPMTGPLALVLTFDMPRPKAHYKGALKCNLRHDAPHLHTSKPDADNLAKAVMDCLGTLGFWKDDAQVCVLGVTKQYSERPGVRVELAQNEITT